jgi:hypothetical protein
MIGVLRNSTQTFKKVMYSMPTKTHLTADHTKTQDSIAKQPHWNSEIQAAEPSTVKPKSSKSLDGNPTTEIPDCQSSYRSGTLLRLELLRLPKLARDPPMLLARRWVALARRWVARTKLIRPSSLIVRLSFARPRSCFIRLMPETSLTLLLFSSDLPYRLREEEKSNVYKR